MQLNIFNSRNRFIAEPKRTNICKQLAFSSKGYRDSPQLRALGPKLQQVSRHWQSGSSPNFKETSYIKFMWEYSLKSYRL